MTNTENNNQASTSKQNNGLFPVAVLCAIAGVISSFSAFFDPIRLVSLLGLIPFLMTEGWINRQTKSQMQTPANTPVPIATLNNRVELIAEGLAISLIKLMWQSFATIVPLTAGVVTGLIAGLVAGAPIVGLLVGLPITAGTWVLMCALPIAAATKYANGEGFWQAMLCPAGTALQMMLKQPLVVLVIASLLMVQAAALTAVMMLLSASNIVPLVLGIPAAMLTALPFAWLYKMEGTLLGIAHTNVFGHQSASADKSNSSQVEGAQS